MESLVCRVLCNDCAFADGAVLAAAPEGRMESMARGLGIIKESRSDPSSGLGSNGKGVVGRRLGDVAREGGDIAGDLFKDVAGDIKVDETSQLRGVCVLAAALGNPEKQGLVEGQGHKAMDACVG